MNWYVKAFALVIAISNLPQGLAAEPENYQKLSACEKQRVLWEEITVSKHETLPELSSMGLGVIYKMATQGVRPKVGHFSDFAPKTWDKYLHRRAVVAKVEFVPQAGHGYTGIFESGSECGLLRLSITAQPDKRLGFAPGLAWKVLRSDKPSVNVAALYTLNGQDDNYNFFENTLSNIVPLGFDIGKKMVHKIFSAVTEYPEELKVNEFASGTAEGTDIIKVNSPRQIFFRPTKNLEYSNKPHDFREDLLTIPSGSVLYEVRAAKADLSSKDYKEYTKEQIKTYDNESQLLGFIKTTSEFVASEFGDTGLFFRHEVRNVGE